MNDSTVQQILASLNSWQAFTMSFSAFTTSSAMLSRPLI
jgi:hypothetical protein